MTETTTKPKAKGLTSQLPVDRLKNEATGLGGALAKRGLSKASQSVESLTGKLNGIAEGSVGGKAVQNVAKGDSPAKAGLKATASKVKDKIGEKLGGILGGGSGQKLKVTNIVESIDVPVSREVAYEQWTKFEEFPTFMKKVENVSQEEDEKVRWKAQIFWSHRTWDATIVDQVPNERIVWKSDGEKGHVDGAVTFHELTPDMTRILLVLEYHPKGLFEHTGNIWRAQGRRARLELKHFRRHVATSTLLHQDEVDGWKGEIHDGEVSQPQDDSDGDDEDKSSDTDGGTDEKADESSDAKTEDDEGSGDGSSGTPGSEKQRAKKPAKKSTKKASSKR